MDNPTLTQHFLSLSTPLIADACLRLKLPWRVAPSGIHSITPANHIAGRVLPARHYGSVDIFLEAMTSAQAGDILVVDNDGRLDEGCIGDLTVLEAQASGLAGLIVWGAHRDTAELQQINLPVFGYCSCPVGPVRLDPRAVDVLEQAHFGGFTVTNQDVVFADADGVIFLSAQHTEEVLTTAESIWQTERRQAQAIQSGRKLRDQLRFDDYISKRSADPTYTFRQHLREMGRAIEE